MSEYIDESRLVAELRARFPQDAAATDQGMRARGWDPAQASSAYEWIEAFAERTAAAIRRADAEALKAHTAFLADRYRTGSGATRAVIDVAYAENVLWNLSDKDKKWAWPFIAPIIRQLHIKMWGDPTR